LIVSLHYNVPQKVIKKVVILFQKNNIENNISPKEYSGYIYPKETIESLVYRINGFNIIMLGDSLTCHNNWGELLNRDDIANFGIGGDNTVSIINRINDIDIVSPEKCFLMIGINDIFGGRSTEEIVRNYKIILKYLKEKDITVTIQSVLSVSYLSEKAWGYNWKKINQEVIELNYHLSKIAVDEGLQFINLNNIFLDGDQLNPLVIPRLCRGTSKV
jgi:hypothetical protein